MGTYGFVASVSVAWFSEVPHRSLRQHLIVRLHLAGPGHREPRLLRRTFWAILVLQRPPPLGFRVQGVRRTLAP